MNLQDYFKERRLLIDQELEKALPNSGKYPHTIYEAMRHSLFAGGKRLRPILALAAYEINSTDYTRVLPTACALECIHTYSLIHDDLPAMDDDDYRRGVPTCHKLFGEAMAILAGDALLTQAFYLIAQNAKVPGISPEQVITVMADISQAIGTEGLIGGQVVDLQSENKTVDAETLYYIHQKKTGALITAAIRAGAILAAADQQQLSALTSFGDWLGLAFQITDDILDIEGDLEKLGKRPGSDLKKKKATYPAMYGLAEAKIKAQDAVCQAHESLSHFGDEAKTLHEIARFVLQRTF